jgi:hypothetical protein
MIMATLQVRGVPAAVYGALAEASKQEHRSLAQQALVVLERGLGLAEDPVKRRQRVLRMIAETPIGEGKSLPAPVELIREDRSR